MNLDDCNKKLCNGCDFSDGTDDHLCDETKMISPSIEDVIVNLDNALDSVINGNYELSSKELVAYQLIIFNCFECLRHHGVSHSRFKEKMNLYLEKIYGNF